MSLRSLLCALSIITLSTGPLMSECFQTDSYERFKPGVQMMNCTCTWDGGSFPDLVTDNVSNHCADCLEWAIQAERETGETPVNLRCGKAQPPPPMRKEMEMQKQRQQRR